MAQKGPPLGRFDNDQTSPKIVCVAGPTATGKTRLAVELALRLGGEVISCDSMQVYRGLSTGTAAPTEEEMRGVPHHMLAVADPREDFSAGRFVEMAEPVLQDILARGKTAILCGGTGLYLDSLMAGRRFAPRPASGRREELARMAGEQGIEALRAYVAAFDPESAARFHDRRRLLRAAEIYLETGETMTAHDARTRREGPKYKGVWLGLDMRERAWLYSRIDRRVDAMLENGLLDEARALLELGVPRGATCLQAIGYKELLPVLDGAATLDEARGEIARNTRRYAKRQRTWFRRNPEIYWIEQTEPPDFPAVLTEALQRLAAFDTRA